jgi:glycosyltransferase involved in cell wall biosynthesis
MPAKTIAAIIPLHNGARWIEGALNSILSQTLKPDEIIVVDDGSTDYGAGARIVATVASGRPEMIRLLHKENGGQSSARNYGVRHSSSDLIALLDQDDAWYPNHLAELIRPFHQNRRPKPLAWVYSDLDEVDDTGAMVQHRLLTTLPARHPKRSLAECLSQDMFVLPSASLICAKAFAAVGGFDPQLCGYEDDDIFLRLFRAGYDNVFIPTALSKWCIRPDSTSYSTQMSTSRMIYAMKLAEKFPNDKKRRRFWVRDCMGPRFTGTLLGEYLTAIEECDKSRMYRATEELGLVASFLGLRQRLTLKALMPLMGDYRLARAIHHSRLAFKLAAWPR